MTTTSCRPSSHESMRERLAVVRSLFAQCPVASLGWGSQAVLRCVGEACVMQIALALAIKETEKLTASQQVRQESRCGE